MLQARCIPWILLLFVLSTTGCERRAETPTLDDVRAEDAPDEESWGVRFFVTEVPLGSDQSRIRMAIEADYMAQYEREDSTYRLLRGHPDSLSRRVVAHIFDTEGDSAATLTANRVFYYEGDKRMEARGQVVVVTSQDKRLESEHLVWYEENREIRTPGFVSIVTPSDQVQGYGLVGDEDLRTFQLARFTAQVTLDDDEEEQ